MKYKILQRYYENTIVAAPEAGDDSLLAAYGGDGGHLTDEHFKHMAEVSGTNIRELESFCERCAGEAGDREREGGELTFDDIDAIASQYFDTSAKKINVQTVQSVIEEQYGVTHEELIGPRRNANIAKARHIAIYGHRDVRDDDHGGGRRIWQPQPLDRQHELQKVQKMIQKTAPSPKTPGRCAIKLHCARRK